MANKKINQLVSKTSILSTDLFGIGDATTGQLFKKTIAELQAAIGGAVISVNGLVGTVVLDTDDIQELATPTNKYFTDARARAAISLTVTGNSGASTYSSGTGVLNVPTYTLAGLGGITATFLSGTSGISYNSTTGVISYSGTVYTDSSIRALLSGGTGITYNSSTGAISYSGTVYTDSSVRALISMTTTGDSGASTYNNTTGVINVPNYTLAGLGGISLTSLSGGTGITYNNTTGAISYSGTVYTDASVRALISATGSVSYNNTTGVISLTSGNLTEATSSVLTITGGSGAVIGGGTSIQVKQATTSVSGFLSSTDWTTFNNKQATITLTTTGTSGNATFSSNTLNIPNYGSALSGYLPLTGGTLTGALGGTSASFSSSVTADFLVVGTTPASSGGLRLGTQVAIRARNVANTANIPLIESTAADGVSVSNGALILASTGAATFSSSVTALKYIANSQATYASLTYEETFKYASSPAGIWFGNSFNSNNNVALQLRTSNDGTSVQALTISPTGAATFSSTLNVGNFLSLSAATTLVAPSSGKSLEMVYRLDGANDYAFIQAYDRTNSVMKRLDLNGAVTILGTGNVLIGRTSLTGGTGTFEVEQNSTGGYTVVVNSSNSIDPSIYLRSVGSAAKATLYTNIDLVLGANSDRMRFFAGSGNIAINTSSDNGYRLYVAGTIYATGNITANSDLTLKKNLELITNPTDKLMQLNGYSYQWKEDDSHQYGVIAQEVEKILPYAVSTGNDGIKGVSYNQIIPVLIEAVKEQKKELEELRDILASK